MSPQPALKPEQPSQLSQILDGLGRGDAPRALLDAYTQLNPKARRQAEINAFRAADRICGKCGCPMAFKKHPSYEELAWFHLNAVGEPLVACKKHGCNYSYPKELPSVSIKQHSPGRYYNALLASWLLYLSPTTLSTKPLFLRVSGSGSSVMLRKNFIVYKLGADGEEKVAPIGSEYDQKLFSWLFDLHDTIGTELQFKVDWSSVYKYGEQLICATFANLGLKPDQILELKVEKPTLMKSWRDLRILDLLLPENRISVDSEGRKHTEVIPGFPLEYLKANMLKWHGMSYQKNHYRERLDKILEERFLASSHRISF